MKPVLRRGGRVRLITRLFPPEVAAAAFRERHLADAFARAGFRTEVITSVPPKGSLPPADGPLQVRRWPVLRDRTGNIRGYLQYLSYDLSLLLRTTIRRPDLYVVEPPPTTGAMIRLISLLQRRPYVWYAADIWSEAAASAGVPRTLLRVLTTLERHVMTHAAAVLSTSEPVTEQIEQLGVPADRVVTVGNGVDTAVFDPDGAAMDCGEPYLAYTGTMSEWQGADVFLQALAEHRGRGGRLRLVFIGQGTQQPELQELAERIAPGAVDFHGVVPPTEAAAWLRGANAGLVSIEPGFGYDFAIPTKIFAATGTGTPVIFAGTGSGADLVREADLGWAPGYDASAIGRVFDLVAEAGAAPRDRLVTWTEQNASLSARASAAVDRIRELLGVQETERPRGRTM